MNTAPSRAKPGQVVASMAFNVEIRKALKIAAAVDDVTMSEKLHEILCREFNRADLLPERDNATDPH